MRVVFVSPAAELGGAERCLLDSVAALRQHGHDVRVLLLADGPLNVMASALGARVQVVAAPQSIGELGENAAGARAAGNFARSLTATPELVRFATRLRHALHEWPTEIVHTNGMKAHLLAGVLAPRRTRLVVHLHDFIGSRPVSRRLLPALARVRSDVRFVANSRAVARDFAEIAPGADIRTIYNVVDTDYFRPGEPEPEWIADRAGLAPPSKSCVTFGLVATYARWKGHALFLEAAGILSQLRPDIALRFYVVGGPIYATLGSQVQAAELLDWARAAKIEAHVGLVPFQADITRVYRSLDVVVHASTRPEPFGRTIVEAMACARGVIVSRAGGAAELYREGVDALGFEPGSAHLLAETMQRLLDAGERERLGQAARAEAVRRFARTRLAAELVDAYASPRN